MNKTQYKELNREYLALKAAEPGVENVGGVLVKCLANGSGDKYVKQFTCYNQLAVLMFGQLSSRESLRDVVLATQAHAAKAYHLGFGKATTKSTMSCRCLFVWDRRVYCICCGSGMSRKYDNRLD